MLSKSNECGHTFVYDGLQILSFRKNVNSAVRGIDNPSLFKGPQQLLGWMCMHVWVCRIFSNAREAS